jgi:hypothetical protein
MCHIPICCRYLRRQSSLSAIQWFCLAHSIFYRGTSSCRSSLSPRTEWLYADSRSHQLPSNSEFIRPIESCTKRLECAGTVLLWMVLGRASSLVGGSNYSIGSSRCNSRFGTLQTGEEIAVGGNEARGCSEGSESVQEYPYGRCDILGCLCSSLLRLFVDYSARNVVKKVLI